MRHRLAPCSALALVLVLACGGVASAGSWSAPERVTGAGFSPESAIGPDGTGAVLWVPQDPGQFGGRGLRFAVRFPDGTYGPHQDLFTDDAADEASMRPSYGEVAVANDGTVSVAWYTGGTIRVATTGAGGVLGPDRILASGVRWPTFDLAAGPEETLVTWAEANEARMAVRRGATFGPAQAGFGVPIEIDAAGGAISVRHAADGLALSVARRPPGGAFGAAQEVGEELPGYWVGLRDFVAHRDGSVALLISTREEGRESGQGSERTWAATAAGGRAVRAPVEIQGEAWDASIGAGPDGAALVSSPKREPMGDGVTRSAGLRLQQVGTDGRARPPVVMPEVESSHLSRVGFDAGGAGVVVSTGSQGTISVTVPPGATEPCPAVLITRHQSIPRRPALDAGAVGLISWQEIPSSNVHVVLHRATAGCPEPPAGPAATPTPTPTPTPAWPPAPEPVVERPPDPDPPAAPPPPPEPEPEPEPEPRAPAPAPAAPVAPAAPAAVPRVASTAVAGAGLRTVGVRITCAGPSSCSGRLDLLPRATTARAVRALGSSAFSVPAGATRTVRVRLAASARRSLRRSRRIRVRVTGPAAAPRVVALTVRRPAG